MATPTESRNTLLSRILAATEAGGGTLNRELIQTSSDWPSTIDSTVEYFIDGHVDMTGVSIEVPAGGINLAGYNFNLSSLFTNESNYTMFTSPVGGSGDILWVDVAMKVSGTSSQLLDIQGATGLEAFEIARVNFNDCTSLGEIDNYRQGLETGTGRFGGTPELVLSGTWVGGYFIETSIVRSLTDGAYSLYKAGTGFSMASRFRSNQNIDLPASASFFDFSASEFLNPSTVQLDGMIMSRNGVFNAQDANLTPNLDHTELPSAWGNNVGLNNTFEGGTLTVTAETTTVISVIGAPVDAAGTWGASGLEHYDSPANGQLRHLGNDPREYKLIASLSVEGPANDVATVSFEKWDNSAASFVPIGSQIRQINSLVGSRNVGFFTVLLDAELDQNDYIKCQVSNESSLGNLTVELGSLFKVEER